MSLDKNKSEIVESFKNLLKKADEVQSIELKNQNNIEKSNDALDIVKAKTILAINIFFTFLPSPKKTISNFDIFILICIQRNASAKGFYQFQYFLKFPRFFLRSYHLHRDFQHFYSPL